MEANTDIGTSISDPGVSLQLQIVEQTSTTGIPGNSLSCIQIVVLDSENYADTLRSGMIAIEKNRLVLSGLSPGNADIILDREGYMPVKRSGLMLKKGTNILGEQILMYRYNVPFAIPGELGIVLDSTARLTQIESIYRAHGQVKIFREPGGYQLKLPFKGTERTRKQTERLSRQLLDSPYVQQVSPLANYTTVVPTH